MLSFNAYAQTDPATIKYLDISKLSPEQKASLMQTTVEMQTKTQGSSNISENVRTEATKWAELGSNLGRATVSAAKEIGLAANDFVATPLGKVTMSIIVFKMVGKDIIKFIVGSIILVVFISTAIILLFKKAYNSVTYEYKPVLWGLYQKRHVTSAKLDDTLTPWYMGIAAVSVIIGLFVGLNVMF